jgi:hypothetical protein
MSADALLSRLEKVRRTGPGRWIARCPGHEDRSPSLSIRELDDGRLLVHDHAGCGVEEILAAVGLDWDALFPAKAIEHAPRVKRPWRVSDLLAATEHELSVAFIVLGDVAENRPVDRERAGEARGRLMRFLEEFRNAAP